MMSIEETLKQILNELIGLNTTASQIKENQDKLLTMVGGIQAESQELASIHEPEFSVPLDEDHNQTQLMDTGNDVGMHRWREALEVWLAEIQTIENKDVKKKVKKMLKSITFLGKIVEKGKPTHMILYRLDGMKDSDFKVIIANDLIQKPAKRIFNEYTGKGLFLIQENSTKSKVKLWDKHP